MTAYRLVKSMNRHLTREEEREIWDYMKANPEMILDDIVKVFEERYKMPVTLHAVQASFVRGMMERWD